MTLPTADLYYLTIAEAADLIRRRELSPVELTRAHLERISETDPKLDSYFTVLSDEAMESARSAEQEITGGSYRGPMHGIPLALKDLYATAGVRTTANTGELDTGGRQYGGSETGRSGRRSPGQVEHERICPRRTGPHQPVPDST